MLNRFAVFLPLSLLMAPMAAAQDDNVWTIDGSHTHVGFKVRHMTVSWTRGAFDKVDGTVLYDGKNFTKAKVDVTVALESIDTENEKRDEHLRSADFFDVEQFPTMTFKSTKIKGKEGAFSVIGELTLHGVTKSVTLDVAGSTTPVTDPWGNMRLGFSATGMVNRQDFGITWSNTMDGGGLVVGDEVMLELDVELQRKAE